MRLSITCVVIVALMAVSPNVRSQDFQIPPTFLSLPQVSVASTDGPLATLSNPAGLGIKGHDSFYLIAPYLKEGDFGDWGLATGGDGFGFTTEVLANTDSRRRYTWGIGGGEKGVYMGVAYSWTTRLDRQNTWDAGIMIRKLQYLSVGAVVRGFNTPNVNGIESNAGFDVGLAFRPMGVFTSIGAKNTDLVTISADVSLNKFDYILSGTDTLQFAEKYDKNVAYKFGVSLQVVPSVTAQIDYMPEVKGLLASDERIFGGLTFALDHGNVGTFHNGGDGSGAVFLKSSERRNKTWLKPPRKRVIKITISGPVVEQNQRHGIFKSRHRTVYDFHRQIEQYADDPEISGLYINLKGIVAGLAKLQEMRSALMKFKESGKSIVVYMEQGGNGSYFLASAADKILMSSTGTLDVSGLSAHMYFLRNAFDKFGIDPQFEHIGDYKSYSDIFTRSDMSDAQAEAVNAILDDFYASMSESIANTRGTTVEEFQATVESGPFTVDEALEAGLIDSIVYRDEIKDILKDMHGEKMQLVSEKKYAKHTPEPTGWEDARMKKIALIYGTGGITSGKSSDGGMFGDESMGSETIVKALRSARENKNVSAIVFRVDSPGGSALASEMILREVYRCTEGDDKKPIIVSMSDVAGSGGYYIACQADKIVALPTTITGSIGVVSGKFTIDELQNKLGINTATLRRGEHADMYAGYRSFTDIEWEKLRDHIDQTYQTFIQRVADGRDMDTSAVNKVGQGRIWSGTRAKDLKLIDEIGGLDLALEMAAKEIGVEDGEEYSVIAYPNTHKYDLDLGVQTLVRSSIPESLLEIMDTMHDQQKWNNGEVLYLMPFDLKVE